MIPSVQVDRGTVMARIFAILLAIGLRVPSAQQHAKAAEAEAAVLPLLQFRDIFRQDRQPNENAEKLAGERVRLEGFFAPQVIDDLPFSVMTGAPTQRCPYCSQGEDEEVFPFLLVYPEDGIREYGARARLIVEGDLEVGLAYDNALNQANFIRMRNARVMKARDVINFAPQSVRHQRRTLPFDPTEIDG